MVVLKLIEKQSYSAPWVIAVGIFDRTELGLEVGDDIPEVSIVHTVLYEL